MRHAIIFAIIIVTAIVALADGNPLIEGLAIRHSVSADKVRVVLDIPEAVAFTDRSTPAGVSVTVALPLAEAMPLITPTDPIATGITLSPDGQGQAVLAVTLAKPRKISVFSLPASGGKPFRLVVDIFKIFRNVEKRKLTPAISYTRFEEQTDDRYLLTHLLDVNTNDQHVRIGVEAAAGGRERIADMVTRTGAIGGVNGGFFLDGTRPVGLLKIDGNIISPPLWGRTAIAFPRKGRPVIGNPTGCWRVTWPNGDKQDITDCLEASVLPKAPEIVVVSGTMFGKTGENKDGSTALIRDGKVAQVTSDALTLAAGEFAIRMKGDTAKRLAEQLKPGAIVTVECCIKPEWARYPCAVGAGPRLLSDGKVEITGEAERFKPDILGGRNSRTALGITKSGHLLFVAIQPVEGLSGGATLEELAQFLKDHGATDAMNLDGGGSTEMAFGGDTVNIPTGTWIRPVASGVLVFDGRGVIKDDVGK